VLGQQTGTDHHGWIGRVGAARNGRDGHGPVAHLHLLALDIHERRPLVRALCRSHRCRLLPGLRGGRLLAIA
jgi:hypothetical protein